MGPWPGDHGNGGSPIAGSRPWRLQWGRGLVTTEILRKTSFASVTEALQWGRGLVTTEIRTRPWGGRTWFSLQWGRGLVTTEISQFPSAPRPAGARFNGAVAW